MKKSLALKKETLKNLSPAQLAEIAGGVLNSNILPDSPASAACNDF